jgi:pyruvate,water dikinase
VSAHQVIDLHQLNRLPLSQAGSVVKTWAKLSNLKHHILPFFILPEDIFSRIAKHNQLQRKLDTLLEIGDWRKLNLVFSRLDVPTDVLQEIIAAYEALDSDFVKIKTNTATTSNISGEHNLVESLLQVMKNEMIVDHKLRPQSLVIQSQNQPDKSGIIYISPTNKNHLIIKAAWGVFDKTISQEADQFIIDTRTNQVVSHHSGTQKTQFYRVADQLKTKKISKHQLNKAPLSSGEIIKLSRLFQEMSRKFMEPQIADFSFKENNLYLDSVKNIPSNLANKNDIQNNDLLGKSITGGVVSGEVTKLNKTVKPRNYLNKIIVADKLEPHQIQIIKQAAGIILTSHHINPTLMKYIQELHLPCIVGSQRATQVLKDGQVVTLNAGAGKVTLENHLTQTQQTTFSSQSNKTVTKVYISAGNPNFIPQNSRPDENPKSNDGVFIKSDYLIAESGIHPHYLIRKKNRQFKKDLLTKTEKLTKLGKEIFYRTCNLNSAELSHLKFGPEFESTEPNPYLGNRGALKLIDDDELFKAEVEMINQLSYQYNQPINLVVPFVRTSSELAITIDKIRRWCGNSQQLKVWLQLNTPANLLHFREFTSLPISGVIIQTKTIHDLAYGIDPDNPQVYSNYSFDEDLIIELLKKTLQELKLNPLPMANHSFPVILKLNAYHSRLTTMSARLGLKGVVVNPKLENIVREQIKETENRLITRSKQKLYYA